MYNVKKKKSLEILYGVMAQLSVIMALFVWLFAIAPFSYYRQEWTDDVLKFVHTCNIINPIVFAVLLAVTLICAFKLKKVGKPGMAMVCSAIIFVVSIVIRVNMLGTYQ